MFKIFDFLSIEFFKQYVSNQYNNDTYQELNKLPIESNQFEDSYNNYKVILKPTWLTNMNYYHENNATWLIILVNKNNDIYRFLLMTVVAVVKSLLV